MVEVRFDEEVWAQGWWERGLGSAPTEALFPLGSAAVGDCREFAGELHARVRWDIGVVEAALPIRVGH